MPENTKLAGLAGLVNQIPVMHGPATSVDGDLAVFVGTGGDTLGDSGIAASAIALDSEVVHKTGEEVITGNKKFVDYISLGSFSNGY